jgi:hypothetical protein
VTPLPPLRKRGKVHTAGNRESCPVPERGQRVVRGLQAHFLTRFDQTVFQQ